jgi:penicillin-binding protein 2
VIALRLFFLQVLKFGEYKVLSDRNRIKLLLLEPPRGLILDRNDVVLADNKVNYQLYFYKERKQPYAETLARTLDILKVPKLQRDQITKTVAQASYVYPILIAENLSWSQVAKIKAQMYTLPGMYLDKGFMRSYPLPHSCSHVIGYMGVPSMNQFAKYKALSSKPFKVGRTGIERKFDETLVGKFGSRKVEVNAYGVIVREISRENSSIGSNVKLSIDNTLQDFIFNKIKHHNGSVVVIDTETLEVLALVSTPTFDPNTFASSITKVEWQMLLSQKSYPLINKAISKQYPPGSVWKIVSALAALRAGIDPEKKVTCTGSTVINGQVYKCWKEEGHGLVGLHDAIMGSCNVYFYHTCMNAGIDNMYAVADELGFGQKTKVELFGELKGVNPNSEWKKSGFKDGWKSYDTVNTSIGQGYVLATPIQLATMIMRLVRGDKATPTMLLGGKQTKIPPLGIPKEHLEFVRQGVIDVVNTSSGTGYGSRITETNFAFAGKTGTAQVISADTQFSRNKSLKSHALFAGFAPIHAPRYAVVVAVDNAGWGSATAAPLARDILLFTQKHFEGK